MHKMSHELITKITSPAVQKSALLDVQPNGYALLVAISRYAIREGEWSIITNESLCDVLGYKVVSALHKIREKCISEGWLEYDNQAAGKEGRYRVIIKA